MARLEIWSSPCLCGAQRLKEGKAKHTRRYLAFEESPALRAPFVLLDLVVLKFKKYGGT